MPKKKKMQDLQRSKTVAAKGSTTKTSKDGRRTINKLFFQRQSILFLPRLIPILVLALMASTCFFFLRGPKIVQENFYPLYYHDYIQESALRHKISPYLLCAVIKAESDWKTDARSHVGARGLLQLMPDTASDIKRWELVSKDFEVKDLDDPRTNIEFGAAYLRYLVDRYHELEAVIAAYNAGPGNVDAWLAKNENIRLSVAFPETKKYLIKVVRSKAAYEDLYPGIFIKP